MSSFKMETSKQRRGLSKSKKTPFLLLGIKVFGFSLFLALVCINLFVMITLMRELDKFTNSL